MAGTLMSAPERLFIKRLFDGDGHIAEELRTCLVNDLGHAPADKAVHTAVPRPDDLAYVLEHATDGWLAEFLRYLLKRAPDRALVVAGALHSFHLGWPDPAAQQGAVDALTGKCIRLEKQLRTQRAELRRFNREARARAEGRDSARAMEMIPLPPGQRVITTIYVGSAQGTPVIEQPTVAVVRARAESLARSVLGVSVEEAYQRLDAGELDGTDVEVDLKLYRYLLGKESPW